MYKRLCSKQFHNILKQILNDKLLLIVTNEQKSNFSNKFCGMTKIREQG